MFYLLLIFNILNISLIIPTNVLLNVQIIWRHGDRPPTEIYQYDPNKNVWSVPLGQLTQKGMRQHYDLGKRFFKKYSQEKKLLNSNYDANQIYVRSTDIDRTLVSAYSNLAGFYAQSKNTYPNDGKSWPKPYTPIPVHTVKNYKDYLLNPNFKCERRSQLEDDRRNNPKFLDYQSTLSNLCEYLTKHSGIKVKGYTEIRNLYSNIRLEKRYYNLPQPSWVTQDIYNQMEVVVNKSINYIHGEEGFGLPDDIELIRLKGGNFAYTILQNIKNTINNNSDTKLYFAFSAHDDTLWAFATVLGFKKKVMGEGYVDYAASFTIELWKNESKNYYIKILYAGNAYDEFKTVTSFIKGCPQSDFCPIEIFENYLKPYIIEKPLNHC